MALSENSNLWLADELWRLGAVEFGEYTLGRTAVGSPIYLNVRKIIGHPDALWRAAQVMHEEITAPLRRAPTIAVALNTFDLTEKEARDAVKRTQDETGLPTTDPVRFDPAPVVEAIETFHRERKR